MRYQLSVFILIVMVLALLSCTEKRETLEVGTHPEGWNSPASDNFHGKMVAESVSDYQNCASCHGKDYAGGTSEVSCFSSNCHSNYPHPEGFVNMQSGQFHGQFIASVLAFNLNTCQPCHGNKFMGEGDTEKNCFASGCHEIFPHKTDFETPSSAQFHGKFIADSLSWDYEQCQSCHGSDYKGDGYAQKNCFTSGCHQLFPHKTGFTEEGSANFHGPFIADSLNFSLTSCESCHGMDFKGKDYAQKNCYSSGCHQIYPHPQNFAQESSADFHGKYIDEQLGGDQTSCQACHGTDYMGEGYQQKNCMSCHSLYPHPTDYASEQSDNFHGDYIAETLQFDLSMCASCHGENYDGDGDPDKNCRTCHERYPHKTDYAVATSADFHGKDISDNLNWVITSCQDCHGTDYMGAGYTEKNCYSCHGNYPHVTGFTDTMSVDFHGTYITETLDGNIESCQACHGTDYAGNGAEIKNCYRCHEQYPHPDNFVPRSSNNFHGTLIGTELNWDLSSCQSCHGKDFKGEGNSDKNCYKCHETYPHEDDYELRSSPNFHGTYIADDLTFDITSCEGCHGTDYSGNGAEVKNCRSCHALYPHAENYASPSSDDFHGDYIETTLNYELESCQSCHGNNFEGNGYTQKNCKTCHEAYPHAEAYSNPQSVNFHGEYIEDNLQWDMTACQDCHGTDYAGDGVSDKSCLTCHTETNGPEACNTCHGGSTNPAPPPDLAENTETTAIGVGAHQPHLIESDIAATNEMSCSPCHVVPQDYLDAGHIKDGTDNAEVVFNLFVTDSGRVNPVWNHDAATCDNTYCHGNFEFQRDSSNNDFAYTDSLMVGSNPTMTWTSVGSGQADCGTCHGLPPQGHVNSTNCSNCHPSVVDANNNIINKKLHINGEINVF